MKKKNIIHISTVCSLLLSFLLAVSIIAPVNAHAATDSSSLKSIIENTIDSDKEAFGKLSPTLQKIYDKLVSAFKKIGTLSKDIAKVVKLYNNLDETQENYPEKLEEFFTEYNKLGTVQRKIVDFCTGVLDAKDKLLASIGHVVTIDLYSEETINSDLEGSISYTTNNESVATVSASGTLTPKCIGFTSIIAKSSNGEQETYRVIVKKPILSTKVNVTKGKSATITLPASTQINEVAASNSKISYTRNGLVITINGLKKGTAYLYIGTKEGKTLKYKVKVS